MEIVLKPTEFLLAAQSGILRGYKSLMKNYENKHGLKESSWDMDVESSCAEAAVAKHLKSFWLGALDTFKDADVGNNVQVRHTKLENGRLIVRQGDPIDHVYILVVGKAPKFKLVGFISGHEAMQEEYLDAPSGRELAYFIPQGDLTPMEEWGL